MITQDVKTRLSLTAIALAIASSAPSIAGAQESVLDGLRSAAKGSPADARAALELGRALRRAGRENEALVELRRGINLARGGDLSIELHWEMARTHIAKRDYGAASVQCKVLGAQPGGAQAGHVCAAEAFLLWKRGSEALPEIAAALKMGKTYEGKVAEGVAFELQLKEADAEASFRDAIQQKPDRVEAHLALGRMLARLGKPDGLVELKKAVELDGKNAEALYELAVASPTPSEQTQLLERAVKERPTYGLALRKLADLQLAQGKTADAKKTAEAAQKVEPTDAGVQVVLGRVALLEGRLDDALKAANAALQLLSSSAGAKLLIADVYAKKGEIDLAVENYQDAWSFDHTDPTPLVSATNACRLSGRSTSARAFGQKVTREFPTWGPGWVALGDALASDRENALAKQAYETALKSKGPVDAADVQRKIAALK
jgi:tetratricopeptide (TPR) repeat protein